MFNVFLSIATVTALIFTLSSTGKYFNDIQESNELKENFEIIKQSKEKIASVYNKESSKITKDDIQAVLGDEGNFQKVLTTNRSLSANNLLEDDGTFIVPKKGSLEYLAFVSKLSEYEDTNKLIKDGVNHISVSQKSISIDEAKNQINQDLKKVIEILYETTVITENSLELIIEQNINEDVIEEDIFKEILFTKLQKSSNPIDYILYNKIENLL